MNFKRTTITSFDDFALAESIFKSFVEKELMIIMVIIGDNQTLGMQLLKPIIWHTSHILNWNVGYYGLEIMIFYPRS